MTEKKKEWMDRVIEPVFDYATLSNEDIVYYIKKAECEEERDRAISDYFFEVSYQLKVAYREGMEKLEEKGYKERKDESSFLCVALPIVIVELMKLCEVYSVKASDSKRELKRLGEESGKRKRGLQVSPE
jgi:hypothetical protein